MGSKTDDEDMLPIVIYEDDKKDDALWDALSYPNIHGEAVWRGSTVTIATFEKRSPPSAMERDES